MFKIGIQTSGPSAVYGHDIDAAYRLIRECGFDAADANLEALMSQSGMAETLLRGNDAEVLALFQPWKDAAEKYGIDNHQAHAPFPTFIDDPDGTANEDLIRLLEKFIMGCAYIGCRKLVIHPFYLHYDQQLSPEEEWTLNIERYSRLIPAAQKYGVMILLENMFTRHGPVYAACCSDMDFVCRCIDTLNEIAGEKRFGFCLDTGHLLLLGLDVKNAMIQLGDRIEAFHVHDNNGLKDQHLAPYMGVLDWNRFVEGLRAIGYQKTLSFETACIWNTVDPELCPSVMRLIAETGRMFARRAAE